MENAFVCIAEEGVFYVVYIHVVQFRHPVFIYGIALKWREFGLGLLLINYEIVSCGIHGIREEGKVV